MPGAPPSAVQTFSDEHLGACRDLLRDALRATPQSGSSGGVAESAVWIQAPGDAPAEFVVRRLSLCGAAGFGACVKFAEDDSRYVAARLPRELAGWLTPMPLVVRVEIGAAAWNGEREFRVEEWCDAMDPDTDFDFRTPRGPRMLAIGSTALHAALRAWRRDRSADPRRPEGWIALSDAAPWHAAMDALAGLRTAGIEEITFEALEQSRRRR